MIARTREIDRLRYARIRGSEWQPRALAGWIGCSTFVSFLHPAIKEPSNGMKTREVLP